MDWSLFLDVFDLVNVSYAVASGLAFGAGPLLWLTLKYPSRIVMSTRKVAIIAGISTAGAFTLFFAGQLVQAIATDPLWPRALGRMALAELFSIAIGLGLGITRSFAKTRDAIESDYE